jgi:hypothetical protein
MRSRSFLQAAAVAAVSTFALVAQAQTTAPASPTAAPADSAMTAAAAFKRVDANQDGKLSKEEAARLPAIADKFDSLDKDKDGALSAEEFSVGAAPK